MMGKKRTIKFCYFQRFNFEIPHGIAVLRALLHISGFTVKEYEFNKHFNSFSRRILSTNHYGKSFLNKMDYRYVHSDNHIYPFKKYLDRIIDSMSIIDSDIIGFLHEKRVDVGQTSLLLKRNKKYISVAELNEFQLVHGSYIFRNPEEFKIKVVRPISRINKEAYKFYEIGGFSWEEKAKQVTRDFVSLKKDIKRLKLNFVHSPRIS